MDFSITLTQPNYRENCAEELVAADGSRYDVVAEPPRTGEFWNFTTFDTDHPIFEGAEVNLLDQNGALLRRWVVNDLERLPTLPERSGKSRPVDVVRLRPAER